MARKKASKIRFEILSIAFLLTVLSLSATGYAAPKQLTINQYFDIETGDISNSINASMDIQCTKVNGVSAQDAGQIIPANNARGQAGLNHVRNFTNLIGLNWDQSIKNLSGAGQIKYIPIVTNQGNYTKLVSDSATNGFCEVEPLSGGITMLSQTPFFPSNATNTYATFATASFQVNDTISFRVDYTDLGYFYENNTYNTFVPSSVIGMDAQYDVYNSRLTIISGVRANAIEFVEYGTAAPLSYLTDKLNCNAILLSGNTTDPFTLVNGLPGRLTPICYYPLKPSGFAGGTVINETTTDLGDAGSVRKDFRVNLAYYDLAFFNQITSVSHNPVSPSPGQNVTVSFLSTLPTNTTVFWRFRNASSGNNEGNFSAWFSEFKQESVFAHSIIIPGQLIFDSKFYQYYVIAGVVNSTNGGTYYNFTVGPISSVIGVGNGTNTVGTAIVALTQSGWCNGSDCVYLFFGLPILIIFTLIGWLYFGATYGKGIFVVLLTLESAIGFLPIFLLVPLIVVVAYILAKQFGLLGGSE